MQIGSCYKFLFHPLHESHSPEVKRAAVITVTALTVLTLGGYLAVWGAVRLVEWYQNRENRVSPAPTVPVDSNTIDSDLIKQQAKSLEELKQKAKDNKWSYLNSGEGHFDWWMFPIDRPSRGYRTKYCVGEKQIEKLKSNTEFMSSYREGVVLVAKSWGWDILQGKEVASPQVGQRWTGYQVRLGKMLHSLILFNQIDLLKGLRPFIEPKLSSLDKWIQSIFERSAPALQK